MATFTYTQPLPVLTNNPATDAVNMAVNSTSINNIIETDHIGFNAANGGQHTKVTLNDIIAAPALVNAELALYTIADSVTAANSFLVAKNTSASFPLSLIRAYGVFTSPSSAGNVSYTNQFNCTGTCDYKKPLATTFTAAISLASNCLYNSSPIKAGVLIYVNQTEAASVWPTYSITNTTLTIAGLHQAGKVFTFVVLQA
jgi:hypothetical protein